MAEGIVARVRLAGRERPLYLPHAIRQMSRTDRIITPHELQSIADVGRLVEDYSDDPRGHTCLLLGFGEGERPIHVVVSPKDEYRAIKW